MQINPTLYPYQEDGARLLLKTLTAYRGAYLADEPGVGKTAQAIQLSNYVCPESVLIVPPAVLKINWQREFEMWDLWGIRPEILTTKQRHLIPDAKDLVVNYDIVHRMPELLDRNFDLVICDESHKLKNKDSKRSQAILSIAEKANNVLLMTGTPMENRPVELWHQLVIMGWIPRDSYMKYVKKHCGYRVKKIRVKGRVRRITDVSGAVRLPELKALLDKRGMVRRRKADVIKDLPPKTYQIVEMPRRKQWRSTLLNNALPGQKTVRDQKAYFKSLANVALATGDRGRLEDSIAEARRLDGEEKIPQVIEFVEDKLEVIPKIIVFAWHTEVIESLLKAFKKYGAVGIYGKTSKTKRQEAIDSFQDDPKVRVIVGNIQAAGVGITLTAASFVIFAEICWIPGLMEQASDRPHRRGQRGNVTVIYLVLENSTDAMVAKSLIEKQKTISNVLDNGAAPDAFKPLNPIDLFK